jgi:thiol-disulfide isomerase/thioredoxin
MPSLISLISSRIQPYRNYIIVIVVLIIFISIGAITYNKYGNKIVRDKIKSDPANTSRQEKEANFMLFTVTWCPHCIKAIPEWDTFSNKFNDTVINGYKIKCTKIDCTDPDDPIVQSAVQKHGIEHYPTMKLMMDENVVDFDAKITSDSLETFSKTMLAANP